MRPTYVLWILVVAAACGGGPAGDAADAEPPPFEAPPLGTFCYTLGGGETCFLGEGVTTTRSLDAGVVRFHIAGALTLVAGEIPMPTPAEMTVTGQVSPLAPLPSPADQIAIAVPVVARCHRVQLIDPFGSCALRSLDVVCAPDLVGAEGELVVAALADDAIAGQFRGQLGLDVRSCCAASSVCADPMEWIDPVPLAIEGRFHLGFERP